ncbi:MAG: hypothetical protein KI793_25530 [Rivularia sp. (in: Bacteria)]|nr:hypothetical protein [Rivularia sp. MS3]
MKKNYQSKTQLSEHAVYFMKDYEHLRKKSLYQQFSQPKNNIYPLKQKFKYSRNRHNLNSQSSSIIKPSLVSIVLICTWSLAILFLAQVSYKFLQEIYLNSAQELYLHRE